MKDLKITEGKIVTTDQIPGYDQEEKDYTKYIFVEGCHDIVSEVRGKNREECLANAIVHTDAHNTYQYTGMTASELAEELEKYKKRSKFLLKAANTIKEDTNEIEKQRDELLEALNMRNIGCDFNAKLICEIKRQRDYLFSTIVYIQDAYKETSVGAIAVSAIEAVKEAEREYLKQGQQSVSAIQSVEQKQS